MDQVRPLARPYYRTPAVSPDGSQLAFIYASDIWTVAASGGVARRLSAPVAAHLRPQFSHRGDRLAFSSSRSGNFDLYTLPLAGGNVERVTFHESNSILESWSADDSGLFFSSVREGQGVAIFYAARRGGTPIQWLAEPYEDLSDFVTSPDGKQAAVVIARNVVWRRGPNPYTASSLWFGSNMPSPEDMRQIGGQGKNYRWPMWRPEGDAVYVVSDSDGAENLWLIDLETGTERRVTSFRDGRLLWPAISADGRTIVFERDFGIWRFDTRTRRVRAVPIHTQPDTKVPAPRVQTFSREISELALSPDAKKVAFVVHGEVFADFADKETDKELRQGPAFRITNTSARESYVAWAPDSRRVVYVSDRHGEPEVYLYDFVTRTETRLTRNGGDKRYPQFSPDGAWIAYMCGDRELRLIDMATQTDRPFISADLSLYSSFAWAPDNKWIVFAAQDDHHFENLYVQRLDDTAAHQISFLSNLRTFDPLWAPNHDFIVFTTGQYRAEMQIARVDLRQSAPLFREREFERLFETTPGDERGTGADPRRLVPPERIRDEENQVVSEPPVAVPERGLETAPPVMLPEAPSAPAPAEAPQIDIQFAGIERRLRLLTPIQLDATALCISPDSRDLVFRGGVAGKTGLWIQALDEPRAELAARQLTAHGGGKWNAQFTPDGKSIYYVDGGQITMRKVQNGDQSFLPISAEVLINFNEEKHQVFEESWRLLRDRLYDETFGGHDWHALHDLYQPLIEGAQTPGDLLMLSNLMIGELGVSHTGINWPYSLPGNQGYTGLIFNAREQAEHGALRIEAVIANSPAAIGGAKVGEYVVAIDGRRLGSAFTLDEALQRSAHRRVRISLAPDRSSAHGREIAIRAINREAYRKLRYQTWIQANEDFVHRISDGRLGYVYISEMSYEAYQQFLIDLDAEAHGKEGIVLDIRFNGGGHTATFFLDVLMRRSMLLSTPRGRRPADAAHHNGSRVLNRPTVLVTNEQTASNAEMMAETYRQLRIGLTVGRPTAGAVLGTYPWRMLDGSTLRLPTQRITTIYGEDLEGHGRPVDIDVALPLGEAGRGRDRQLEAAVQALLNQIDGVETPNAPSE